MTVEILMRQFLYFSIHGFLQTLLRYREFRWHLIQDVEEPS
jgi:hypothetical protein